ncbi:MAG: hypothetical protein AAGD14_07275 [Planctomycetota bacterium]
MPSDSSSKTNNKNGRKAADKVSGDERRILPERRGRKDRRAAADRRSEDKPVAVERRGGNERRKSEGERRKVERRINEYPLQPEVLEFINAVNEFKSTHQKPFPTWTEIFQIFKDLGYTRE